MLVIFRELLKEELKWACGLSTITLGNWAHFLSLCSSAIRASGPCHVYQWTKTLQRFKRTCKVVTRSELGSNSWLRT